MTLTKDDMERMKAAPEHQPDEVAKQTAMIRLGRLPQWSDCELALRRTARTALMEFIYEYEPGNARQWRKALLAALKETCR